MADWPVQNTVQRFHALPESGYIILPDYTVGNTKGAWVQLVAATPFDSAGITIKITAATYNGEFLTDLAMGAAGSEIVLIGNIYSYQQDPMQGQLYHFPLYIPSGVRLSARQQGTYNGTNRHRLAAMLSQCSSNNPLIGSRVTTLGANTADCGGVAVDPGATADTKGAWSELSASCPHDCKGFILSICNDRTVRTTTTYYWNIDVGIGAAGSEVVIMPNYSVAAHSAADVLEPAVSGFIPFPIKAGERIAVRTACSGNNASYRKFSAILYLIG